MIKHKLYTLHKIPEDIYGISTQCKNYLLSSAILSNIKLKNIKKIYENNKYTQKILNLNHNGALLPKIENQSEFFSIFEKFKKILRKKIPKNCLIHFPIIIRLNNTLMDKKKKYSATHPHVDSWAGQPQFSKIISYNVISSENSPTLEILDLKKNKRISLSKKKSYKDTIKLSEVKSIYKSQKNDLCILEPGTIHRTSRGNKFRITLECRFVEKSKIRDSDPDNLKKYYFSYKKFFKINQKNTKIINSFGQIALSRFGVDFKSKSE